MIRNIQGRNIQGRNVAVVGGAGFLGSHLVNHLVDDRDCNVIVIDNLVVGRREFIHPKAGFVYHDITGSESFLYETLLDNEIDFVFNYAAYPYIPVSYERPLHVFNVNAVGAIKVINAATDANIEAILQVSSAEIYGDDQCPRADDSWGKITEKAPVTPHSTYGVAKLAVDSYVQCSWKERKSHVIALRQFNCIGERETHPYVVPEIILQIHDQLQLRAKSGFSSFVPTPITIRLGNNSNRDFMYAGDAVRSAVLLLENGDFGEVYNLGSERSIQIYDLAKLIGSFMTTEEIKVVSDCTRRRPWEIWALSSSNEKIKGVIGDIKTKTLEESLKLTIAWYKSNGFKWPWEYKECNPTKS